MIKVIWYHYNDTPNRRIFISNLTGKQQTIDIKTNNVLVPGCVYVMGSSEKSLNYPLEEACIATIAIGDHYAGSFSFDAEDVSLTLTIAER